MGLYDRDYTQQHSQFRHGPQMRMRLPSLTPAVKSLIGMNVAIFVVEIIFFPANISIGRDTISSLDMWFAVFPYSIAAACQVWRLISYQFLHGGFFHIAFNMLWLYFLGTPLEQQWGSRKFIVFYLSCGAVGGLFYTLLVAVGYLAPGPMVGASGAVLGVFAACAILFPHFLVYLLPFPVAIPIRLAAIIGTVMYLLFVATRSYNAGGHAAHLAGMAAGAAYVFSRSWRERTAFNMRSHMAKRRSVARHELKREVDRILEKVHTSGIHSLTTKEKRILRRATEQQQIRNPF